MKFRPCLREPCLERATRLIDLAPDGDWKAAKPVGGQQALYCPDCAETVAAGLNRSRIRLSRLNGSVVQND